MTSAPKSPAPSPDEIQPVVLAGGASARFGRNKLLEPLSTGELLVDRPINALRAVFGARVALVGRCGEPVASRGDKSIADSWEHQGPAGGIASALAHFKGPIFVLAGDLPGVSEATVRAILDYASSNPRATAVLGSGRCPEPCIGLYRQTALAPLERSLRAGESLSVLRRLEGLSIATIPLRDSELVNANTPEQLAAVMSGLVSRGSP